MSQLRHSPPFPSPVDGLPANPGAEGPSRSIEKGTYPELPGGTIRLPPLWPNFLNNVTVLIARHVTLGSYKLWYWSIRPGPVA